MVARWDVTGKVLLPLPRARQGDESGFMGQYGIFAARDFMVLRRLLSRRVLFHASTRNDAQKPYP
jgi:hypothetical protein